MNVLEINNVQPILHVLLHDALMGSIHFIDDKCKKLGNKPQEPDFIAALTLKFTDEFFNILKAFFPRNRFSVTGIFCHQKPLANFGRNKTPEIGDLLLVYIYTDNKGAKKLNSLLLQAKISTKTTITIAQTDQHQLQLYSEWPAFTYQRAGLLNGKRIDVLPKTINDGAQYLLIDNHPKYGLSGNLGTFPMGCAIPAKTLCIDDDLISEIINFLKFKSGRAFEQDFNTTKDDWTTMIWDILHIEVV